MIIIVLCFELEFVDTYVVGVAIGRANTHSNAHLLWNRDALKLDVIQHFNIPYRHITLVVLDVKLDLHLAPNSPFRVTTPSTRATGSHSSLLSLALLMAIDAGLPSQDSPVRSIPTPTIAPFFPTKPRGPAPTAAVTTGVQSASQAGVFDLSHRIACPIPQQKDPPNTSTVLAHHLQLLTLAPSRTPVLHRSLCHWW